MKFLNKADALKHEFTHAYDLLKAGLITNIERLYIHMQIFKELARYYRSVCMLKSYDSVLNELNKVQSILKVDAPELLQAK